MTKTELLSAVPPLVLIACWVLPREVADVPRRPVVVWSQRDVPEDVAERCRAAGFDERGSYRGFDARLPSSAKPIAVVDGTFSKHMSISATLYIVADGMIRECMSCSGGRSPNKMDGQRWADLCLQFALQSGTLPDGHRFTRIGLRGHEAGGAGGFTPEHDIDAVATQTFSGKLEAGREYLLHVEGDRPFDARREMSVEEFAESNPGNFVVVVVTLIEW